jgi:2',3'-cyclic-nucleotide 2'-phosphodiesterase (5'-nucleotidase family)
MKRWAALWGVLLLNACAGAPSATNPSPERPLAIGEGGVTFVGIADSIPGDPAVEALVGPFRARLDDNLSRVIGVATGPFENGHPEGTLGNLATAAMLRFAREAGNEVEIAVTNAGGLRIPIQAGPITLGAIYEVAPFDNRLTLLEMDSSRVAHLADQVAALGGEPIAGLSFTINESRRASNIRVQGNALDGARRYHIVTLDYLVDGGGQMRALSSFLSRRDLPTLLREALVEYIEAVGTVSPVLDGRISSDLNERERRP